MSRSQDDSEVVYPGELSLSPAYFTEHDEVNLDDVIRLNEYRQAVVDSDYPDFWEPVEA